jgi:hypothetical protein
MIQNRNRLRGYQLFIATEDRNLVKAFDAYKPQTSETLGVNLSRTPLIGYNYLARDRATHDPNQMDFYPDFYLLSKCEVILAPSSTFSFVAGMLSERLKEFWRSNLDLADFEQIDPWDDYPLLRQNVKDYLGLEGISLKQNPYWK